MDGVIPPETTLKVQVLIGNIKSQVYKHLTPKLFYMCQDFPLGKEVNHQTAFYLFTRLANN